MHKFHLKVQAANCANSGVIIPVPMAEFMVTEGIYCGQNLGSVGGATAPNVIPGNHYFCYLFYPMIMYNDTQNFYF